MKQKKDIQPQLFKADVSGALELLAQLLNKELKADIRNDDRVFALNHSMELIREYAANDR